MRKYQESGKLETVICNGCGKKLVVERGILREGGFSVNYPWDYFSEKDGETGCRNALFRSGTRDAAALGRDAQRFSDIRG